MRKNHPQRTGRSGQFASYLANLSPEERSRIESAERQFLAKSAAPFSRQVRAARDFGAGMAGFRETKFDTQ